MKRKNNPVSYVTITNFKTNKIEKWLEWWSEETRKSDFTLTRTPAFFRNNLLFAVFAFYGEKIVGAAGIIASKDERTHSPIIFKKKSVVELCSNCVDLDFRKSGIGMEFLKIRMGYVDDNGFVGTSVTKEDTIISFFEKLGWQDIDKLPEYKTVKEKIRFCECENAQKNKEFFGSRCSTCPLLKKSIWVMT